jgi:hypothetical protein
VSSDERPSTEAAKAGGLLCEDLLVLEASSPSRTRNFTREHRPVRAARIA